MFLIRPATPQARTPLLAKAAGGGAELVGMGGMQWP